MKDVERLWNPMKTRKRRREALRSGSVHMNVSSRTTTATWSSKMSGLLSEQEASIQETSLDVESAPDPVRGEPRTGRPTGCQIQAGPTARWDTVCVSIWIYAYADITLNLRRVQMSPSICVVADDEYDRNHRSPSRVGLQLLNAELLREIIRKTPPRTP